MDVGVCNACGYFEGRCRCGKGEIILKADQRVRVSKFLSGLLRHFASNFDLKIDVEGWARIKDVEKILRERYGVGRKEIELIVMFDKKGRFEIKNDRIRARYGHSLKVRTDWSESDDIPPKLYHATDPQRLPSIFEKGLLPMKRIEVHLCDNPDDAVDVGKRHCNLPALLEIDARKMIESGYRIRKKGRIYTTDFVPPKFIRLTTR